MSNILTVDANGRGAPATLADLQAISGFVNGGSGGLTAGTLSLDSYSADKTGVSACNTALTTAMAAVGSGTLIIPAGTYKLNNDTGPLVFSGFAGKLICDQGAVFQATTPNQMGIQFSSGQAGGIIDGLTITATGATSRNDGVVGLYFYQADNIKLKNTTVSGFSCVGIQFESCKNVFASNIAVSNTMADGLDFFNCQNPILLGYRSSDTGDDGLAFVKYPTSTQHKDLDGGLAVGVVVERSNARGISIVGPSNVTVMDFYINQTTNAGIIVLQDTYISGRTPTNARFCGGTITGAGTWLPTNSVRYNGVQGGQNGIAGNNAGIQWALPVGSGSCVFENITLTGCVGNSSFGTGMNHPIGIQGAGGECVALRNITVDGVSGHGLTVGLDPLGTLLNQTGTLEIKNVTVRNATGVGIYLTKIDQLVMGGTIAQNCGSGLGSSSTPGEAVHIEAVTNLAVVNTTIIDTQGTPTGYKFVQTNNQRGVINGIPALIPNGSLTAPTASGSVTVTV